MKFPQVGKIFARRFSGQLFLRAGAFIVFGLCVAGFLFVPRPREIHAATTTLLGDTAVESTHDSNSAGMAEAFQTTATASGSVSSMVVYVGTSNSATNLVVGLYSNSSGKPGTLLSQGSSTATLTKGAWNTVAITPVGVTSGTAYWIAVLGTGGTLYFQDGGTSCSSMTSSQSNLTSLATSWTTGSSWPSCQLSAYGTASSTGPVLSLSSPNVSFTATQGGANPASASVTVTNTGAAGTLSFNAGSDTSWLAVSPATGTTSGTLTMTATVGSLTAGTYTGHVTVTVTTAGGAQGSPATITVTFTVQPPPTLSVSKSAISFTANQGGSNPGSSSVSVTNSGGGGALSYSAASDSTSWLTVSPASGTTSGTLTVSAKTGSLTAGAYTGHITVTVTTAGGAQNSPATITVTFTVQAPATLSLSTSTMLFNATQGGANPASSSVTVTNSGTGGSLSYSTKSDSSWLTASPTSGTTSGTVTISAKTGTLTAGTYTGHITVTVTTSGGAQGSPGTITVTFQVAAPGPVLSVATTSVAFSATQGGASPASSSVSVTNTGGGGALTFTTGTDTNSSAWLSATSPTGTTPGSVVISAKVGSLTAATYTGYVTVTAAGARNSPTTITVTFTVQPAPSLSVFTSVVSFSATQGGANPASSSVNVTNAGGGGALAFTIGTDTNSSSWLSASSSTGTTPGSVVISAKVGTLSPATYTGYVTVAATATGAQNSPQTITVTFVVASQPMLSVPTTPLLFSGTQGSGVNPASASISVSNTASGGSALNFTAASDSPWLSVSPGSGTTPSSLTISALLGNQLVGTYTGNITVTSTGAQGSPATIPVTFTVSPILGDSNLEANVDPVPSGEAQVVRAIAAATGSLNSVSVYLDSTSTASQIDVGVYSDESGQPNALLGQGNIGQGGSSKLPSGWNNVGISTGNTSAPNLAVTANTAYWIAMLGTQGGTPVFRVSSTPNCPNETSSATTLTALSAQWPTGGPSGSACPLSIYGVLTPNISGIISGVPIGKGPTVASLTGSATSATTADSSGNYAFSGLANSTYTVTPSNSNYTFTPANQTANINSSSVTGINFSTLYSISGNVGAGAGVTVYLTGASSASTVTNSSGNYSFGGLTNGSSYTISPSDIAYIFTPSGQSVTISGDNVTGVNFAANSAPPGYTISGKITLSSKGLGGGSTVTLTLQSTGATVASTTADSSGNFTLAGVPNGSYVVTPTSQSAAFTPAYIDVTINNAGYTSANFTAAGLIFYDDFSGTTLNSGWVALNRHGDYSNSELQCYLPGNVTVSGGFLSIETLLQTQTCGDYDHTASSSKYTSGMIQWSSINFTYGTIEYRAMMPGGSTWPAIWTLGYNCQASNVITADNITPCNWPAPGSDEIDITEIIDPPTHINQEIHSGSHNVGCTATTTDVTQNYHTYDLIWSKGSLIWEIDGKVTCTLTQNVPSTSMFLIINTAVNTTGVTLPQTMSVNYVKVTQP